jgi:CheY-like chemotaxis protein
MNLAFEEARLPHPHVLVRDGKEVVDYLSGNPPFVGRDSNPLPSFMLLDLKMPRMDGFDVLEWLARRPEFNHIPAYILSSFSNYPDVQRARELGAKDYLVKPVQVSELVGMIQKLYADWNKSHGSKLTENKRRAISSRCTNTLP